MTVQVANFPVYQDETGCSYYDFGEVKVTALDVDGNTVETITPTPVRYAQEYSFAMPDCSSVLVELVLDPIEDAREKTVSR